MTRDSLKGSNDRREEIVILSSDEEDREYQRKRTNDKLKALASNSIDVSGTSPSSKTRHRRSRSPRIIDHRPSKGSSRHSRERSRDKSRDRYRDKSRDRHRGRSRDRSKEERKNRTRERSRSRHKSRDRRRSRDSSRDRFTSRDRDRRSRDRFERSRSRNRSRRRTPIRSRRSHSRDRIRKSPSPYLGAGPKLGDLLFQMDTLAGSVDRSESPEAKVEVKENGNRRSRSRSHSKSKHLSRHSRSSPNRKNKRSSRSRSGTPKRKHESSTKKKKHKKEKESDHKEHLSDKKKKHRKKKKSEKRSESRADSPSLETSCSPKSTKSQLETSSQKHPPKQSRSDREAKSTPDARSATPESAPSPPPTPHSAPSAEVSDVGSSSSFRQTNVADLSHEPVSQTASSLEDLERDNAAFAEDDLEQQALQVIALLKNEVADPELAPPAQPPKSVAQKPLVIDWLVQRLHNQSNDGKTPPKESTSPQPLIIENSATVGDESESLVSAQELTNQQNLDKLVGQERVAEEVKIVLKPFYCKGTITKEEYKLIMRNCVTKIYQRSQGRVNPTRVKDYVEKYVGTVIARRK